MSLQKPEKPPKRECLLTAAGSQEVNGSYIQTSDEDLFYKKKYTAGDPAGIVYIITLESLPELGEDFEVAWALQSHNADSDDVVTFYATPCDEPEAQGFPLIGWITVSGLEPVPRLFPRPIQLPRDRTSSLDIIEENLERDFSIEPFWANDHDSEASGDECQGMFPHWDQDFEEPSSEGEDSDYGEVEFDDDIMENFKDGTFVHKPNQVNSTSDERMETLSPRRLGTEVDSDTSEDFTIIKHDHTEFPVDQSDNPSKPSVSNQADEKEEVGNGDKFNLTSQVLEPETCTDKSENTGSTVDLMNPDLAYARSQGTKGEITIVDLRTDPPGITGARIGSFRMRDERVGSRQQDEIDFKIISPPYKPLIAPPKDPFISSISEHTRCRTGRDHVDVDLISALVPQEVKTSRQRVKNPINERSPRKTQINRKTSTDNNRVGVEDKEEKQVEFSSGINAQTIPSMAVKTDVIASQPLEKKRDPEREKLEEEMHQLKTKMRKCDRLSKLRKRGRNLTKAQQDTLVEKSKYQKRIEELRRLLGSDIGRS